MILLLSAVLAAAPAQTIAHRLDAAEALLAQDKSTDPDSVFLHGRITTVIQRARGSLGTKRTWLALEDLSRVETFTRALQTRAAHRGEPLDAFWTAEAKRLEALDEQARARDFGDAPAAVRALAESAQGQVVPLVEASRAYAKVTDAATGFFYLGQAAGYTGFAASAAQLGLARRGSPAVLRSWTPELQQIQQATIAAYQPPRSVDQHAAFIALNAQIKLASELDERRAYAGALYAYLDAVQQLGVLDLAPPTEDARPRLRRLVAAAEKRSSGRDQSIRELFVQRAAAALQAPDDAAWAKARAIVERVLPAWDAAQKGGTGRNDAAAPELRVTLVRWPYT